MSELKRQSTLKGSTRGNSASSGLRKRSRTSGKLQGDKGAPGVERFEPTDFRPDGPKSILHGTGKALIGNFMYKMFKGKDGYRERFKGTVTKYENSLYHIKYPDGDREDLTLEEMKAAHRDALKPKKRKRAPTESKPAKKAKTPERKVDASGKKVKRTARKSAKKTKKTKKPKPKKERAPRKPLPSWDADTTISVQQDNPKRAGSKSAIRYDGYKSAKTVQEFLDLGGSRADLRHDIGKGYITL